MSVRSRRAVIGGNRRLDAYIDAVHHLAWLASTDYEDRQHGECGPGCPGWEEYDLLATVSAQCDGGEDALPSEYAQAAVDLLALAQHDDPSPTRRRQLAKAIALVVDVAHRQRRAKT